MYNNGLIMTDTIGNNLKTKDISKESCTQYYNLE